MSGGKRQVGSRTRPHAGTIEATSAPHETRSVGPAHAGSPRGIVTRRWPCDGSDRLADPSRGGCDSTDIPPGSIPLMVADRGAVQANFSRAAAPWPVARGRPLRRIASGAWPGWFFHNPVVGHTRDASKFAEPWFSGKVSGSSSTNVDPLRMSREDSSAPLLACWGRYSEQGNIRASRDAREPFDHDGIIGRVARCRPGPVRTRMPSLASGRHGGRRGRIGVVKLLRARGGCLGVIRWRAWKAAKGPGELPNERRSRNTRWRPGELKHLSTRRKRNQPRLPQ